MPLRAFLLVGVLFGVLVVPACAHDSYWGLMQCYGTGHCAQNRCVFGIIIAESASDYTLEVTKSLRGRNMAGAQMRIQKGSWNEVYPSTPTPATVGDGLAVAFSSETRQPYAPTYVLRSASPGWRTMTLYNGSSGAARELESFVRSGGQVPPLAPVQQIHLFLDDWGSAMIGSLLLAVAWGIAAWRRGKAQQQTAAGTADG